MKKMLISDLYGTLLEYDIYSDDISKCLSHLLINLKSFLEEGNELIIVTSSDNHDSIEFVLNKIIIKLYSHFSNFKNQIKVFFEGSSTTISKSLFVKDDCFYYSDLKFYLIKNKKDVYKSLEKMYNFLNYRLYSLGDSINDLPMILESLIYNGEPSLIDNSLYSTFDLDFIIKELSVLIVNQNTKEFYEDNINKVDWNNRSKLIKEERIKLYNLIITGNITEPEIRKLHYYYKFLDSINEKALIDEKDYTKYSINDLKDINIYPSFLDYKQKVLMQNKYLKRN